MSDNSEIKKIEYITTTKIKEERHWTDSMIKYFLGEADKTEINPIFHSAAPMRKYKLERVIESEQTIEFQVRLEKATKRKAIGLKVADIKRKEIQGWAKSTHINYKFPNNVEEVIEKGFQHYIRWQQENNNYDIDTNINSHNTDNLHRWAVNWLRHERTTYDKHLINAYGKVGASIAHDIIKDRILSDIIKQYPILFSAAQMQITTK